MNTAAHQLAELRERMAENWPEPTPLPDTVGKVADFDNNLLPSKLQPWAADISDRIQCAPDYVGSSIMVVLGSLIGRKIGVRPQERTDWTEVPNQWGMLIGRPGVLKSPALEAVLSPIKRLAAKAHETHEDEMAEYSQTQKLNKLKAEEGEKAARKRLKDNPSADVSELLANEDISAPILKRYITNDSTAAGLGELLRQNHDGVLVHRDELVSLLKMLDREDNAEARGFYLTGWNGNSAYTIDRIGRGMNLHIPAVCLSLLGSTQPGKVAGYLRSAVKGGIGDDGLIQRFGLMVWPDTTDWKDVDRYPDGEAKRDASRIIDHLDALDPLAVGARQDTDYNGEPEGVPYLRFDDAGLGLFREWRVDLEAKLNGDLHPALESHIAKYRKLVPTLALILHLADGNTGDIGERPTVQALAWAEYLETHARRAYGAAISPDVATARAIINRLKRGDLESSFSRRDVWRPQWSGLTDAQQVSDALVLLVDFGWLRAIEKPTAGRTAIIYEAHPSLGAPDGRTGER